MYRMATNIVHIALHIHLPIDIILNLKCFYHHATATVMNIKHATNNSGVQANI